MSSYSSSPPPLPLLHSSSSSAFFFISSSSSFESSSSSSSSSFFFFYFPRQLWHGMFTQGVWSVAGPFDTSIPLHNIPGVSGPCSHRPQFIWTPPSAALTITAKHRPPASRGRRYLAKAASTPPSLINTASAATTYSLRCMVCCASEASSRYSYSAEDGGNWCGQRRGIDKAADTQRWIFRVLGRQKRRQYYH